MYKRSRFSGTTATLGNTCVTTVVGVVSLAGNATAPVIGDAPGAVKLT